MTRLWHQAPVAFALAAFLPLFLLNVESHADLKRNPFDRPATEASADSASTAAERREPEWSPELRAVLSAGPKSVVDLGGVVLSIGESTNGYRLLAVGSGTATFSQRGKKVVISLYEQETEEQ